MAGTDFKLVGVVQVKSRSDLYPERRKAKIGDTPLLDFLLKRLKEVSVWEKFILATTNEKDDDEIEKTALSMGVEVFRGDSSDVISRIYSSIEQRKPDAVVTILGNYPLIDIEEMERLVETHCEGGYDYSYNEHFDGVILGMGCSVFSFDVIKKLANSQSLTKDQKEIGSLYIRQHPDKFKILKQDSLVRKPNYRVNVDNANDAQLVTSLVRELPVINSKKVGVFLDKNKLLLEYQKDEVAPETGVEKVFLFPNKIAKFINGGFDGGYPISVELSLTNACNFNCDWCSDKNLRGRLGGEFTAKELSVIFEDLVNGGTTGVVIEGGGEPTIHPEFNEIVLAAKEKGLALGLITNGSVKLKPKIIKEFEWIRVSLDAATPRQHEHGKKVKVYEEVLSNIKYFGENNNGNILGIGYVVTKNNVENLENLLLRLSLYHIDYIQFRPVIDHPDLSGDVNLSYLKKYSTNSFKVDISAMLSNKDTGNKGVPCFAHSLSTVITADAGVYLCGRLNIYDWVKPIGNLKRSTFKEIWFGDERLRQVKQVSDSEFCTMHCPACRMTKYNLLISRTQYIKTRNFI